MSQPRYNSNQRFDSGIRYADGGFVGTRGLIMNIIKNTLRLLLLPQFMDKLKQILTAIAALPAFASLTAQVTALQTKLTALVDKDAEFEATKTLLDTLRTERNDLRTECQTLAMALAGSVEGVAAGDLALIQASGFDIRAGRGASSLPAAPGNLRARMGQLEGTIALRWNAVPNASNYIVEMATVANGPWTQLVIQPQAKYTVDGLTSGTKYYFHVRAVGYLGAGPFSDLAEKMAP
jgi:hypothetical protein